MIPTKPIPTLEEELFDYFFAPKLKSHGKPTSEATARVLELLAELVGRDFNTFDLVFRTIWALKPLKHGKSEEYTRLRIYELLQRACLCGLVVRRERLYELPEKKK